MQDLRADAPLLGFVDFSKSCNSYPLPEAGWPVGYQRCADCGLLFTTAFDSWQIADFAQHIYNDDYIKIDPEYLDVRPAANAAFIAGLFGRAKDRLAILDYGAGNRALETKLTEAGFANVVSYDPFNPEIATPPDGRFDLLVSFETLEHVPDPLGTFRQMAAYLRPDGAMLFSTLPQAEEFAANGLGWWYVAPRNGHISISSGESMLRLCADSGLTLYQVRDGTIWLAVRGKPDWIKLGG